MSSNEAMILIFITGVLFLLPPVCRRFKLSRTFFVLLITGPSVSAGLFIGMGGQLMGALNLALLQVLIMLFSHALGVLAERIPDCVPFESILFGTALFFFGGLFVPAAAEVSWLRNAVLLTNIPLATAGICDLNLLLDVWYDCSPLSGIYIRIPGLYTTVLFFAVNTAVVYGAALLISVIQNNKLITTLKA